MAMTIKEIRHLTGYSQRTFAKFYHIPVRTVENWETTNPNAHRDCPEYVRLLLEKAVRIDFDIPSENKKEGDEQ